MEQRWLTLRRDVVRAVGLIVQRLDASPGDPVADFAARFARLTLALMDDHEMDRNGRCVNPRCASWWGRVRRVCPTLRVVRHHLSTDPGLYAWDLLIELTGEDAGLAAARKWLKIDERQKADAQTQPIPAILDHDGYQHHTIPAQPPRPGALARA